VKPLPRIHKRPAPAGIQESYLGWLGSIQQFYLGWLVGTVYSIQQFYLGWLVGTVYHNPTEISLRFQMVFACLYKGYS